MVEWVDTYFDFTLILDERESTSLSGVELVESIVSKMPDFFV